MPPDVPRCRGLKPGMPCPVPDDCDCKRMDAEMDAAYWHTRDPASLYIVAMILAAAVAIVVAAVWNVLGCRRGSGLHDAVAGAAQVTDHIPTLAR